jgi:hypothetical protein
VSILRRNGIQGNNPNLIDFINSTRLKFTHKIFGFSPNEGLNPLYIYNIYAQICAKPAILYEMKQSRFILRGYHHVDIDFSITAFKQTLR